MELAEFWDTELEVKDKKFNPDKELKKLKKTNIERGDLIILGKHKLLCADALNQGS